MKRLIGIICLILFIMFSVSMFIACAGSLPGDDDGNNNPPNTEGEQNPGEQEPEEDDYIPPTNFDDATSVRIMSYNVLSGNQGDAQSDIVYSIKSEAPDVLGVQEAYYTSAESDWPTYLKTNLTGYTAATDILDGVGIFYRTDKYNLIQGGIKWYSLTPNRSSTLDTRASTIRAFVFAKLQDKTTGSIFVYFNTHLDYDSSTRAKQQATILTKYANEFKDYPIFVTGDFNQHDTSETYAKMTETFVDSSLAIDWADRVGTFNGWHEDPAQHTIIDYCFVSKDNVEVLDYQTLDEVDGYMFSDHFAIVVDVQVINLKRPQTNVHEFDNILFKIGDVFYGDTEYNDVAPQGVQCTLDYDTLVLTIESGVTLTLDGIETSDLTNLKIMGAGSVEINGNVKTIVFTTADETTVTINGRVRASLSNLGEKTTVVS